MPDVWASPREALPGLLKQRHWADFSLPAIAIQQKSLSYSLRKLQFASMVHACVIRLTGVIGQADVCKPMTAERTKRQIALEGNPMSESLYLEDLVPGASWTSPGRTLTETDVISFAGTTGDFDPLHVDREYAAKTPYGKPIVHGLLGLSMMAGLSSTCPRVKTLALVRIADWQFERPIFVGDTVHAVTQIESITPRGRRSGEVTWFRRLINQRGECVQSGRITTLVSSHAFLPRAQPVPAGVKMGSFKPSPATAESATDA